MDKLVQILWLLFAWSFIGAALALFVGDFIKRGRGYDDDAR